MKRRRIFHLILATILFFYASYLSYIYLHKLDPSPSILVKEHESPLITGTEVIRGSILHQDIKASYDNLGIIAVRFQTFSRINDDVLTFRLKEKNNPNIIYSAKYKTDQFQDRQFFPFGFPLIQNSKNRTYEFEIESSTGSVEEHVSIDKLKPVVLTKYQYPLRELNPTSPALYSFIVTKVHNFFSNDALIFPLIYYFLPFTYFILHLIVAKFKKGFRYSLILLPLIVIVSELTASLPPPPSWQITIALFWIIYILINKLDFKINIAIACCFIPLIIHQLIEENPGSAETFAYWLFVFLSIGYFHSIIISLLNLTDLVSLKTYLSKLFQIPKSS